MPEHTFPFTDYDKDGNKLDTVDMPYRELSQGRNSWFFEDPLWVSVTATEDGHVTIKGRKTQWVCGVVPDRETEPGFYPFTMPCIHDRDVQVW